MKNTDTKPLKDLRIGVICKDRAGKVIGGGSDYPDLVPPSGESGSASSCTAYIGPGIQRAASTSGAAPWAERVRARTIEPDVRQSRTRMRHSGR